MEKRAKRRPKRSYPDAPRVIVECELEKCIHCCAELENRKPWHMRKTIQTLKGPLFVAGKSKKCVNPECEHSGIHYYATGVLTSSLPESTYGLDVVAYIGWRHENDHRQLVEIHQELNEKGVEINERNVGKLYRRYLALLGAMSEKTEEKLEQTALKHGGLIWAIDALQPEGNGGLLYVLYEALSGIPVGAIQLESGTEERLSEWLTPYAALPIKALATLCDGEKAIIVALRKSWPDAPLQRCQLHFLNNLAEAVMKVDTQLRNFIVDDVGGIPKVPTQQKSEPSPEQSVVFPAKNEAQPRDPELIAIESQLRLAVSDSFHHKSRKPYHWAGLVGYQQLEAIAQSLENVPYEPETAYLHQLAGQVTRAVEKNRTLATDLQQAHQQLKRIAECLRYPPSKSDTHPTHDGLTHDDPTGDDPNHDNLTHHDSASNNPANDDSRQATSLPTSQTIAKEMQTLIDTFQPNHKRQNAQSALHRALHRTWKAFGKDLLHTYDISGLPPDNLHMEALFGRLRRHQRRISGRKSTAELRNFGHCQILFLATSQHDLLQQMQLVSTDAYLQQRQILADAEEPRLFLHRLHRNSSATIGNLVTQHHHRRHELLLPQLPHDHVETVTPTVLSTYGNLKRVVPAFIRKWFATPDSHDPLPHDPHPAF